MLQNIRAETYIFDNDTSGYSGHKNDGANPMRVDY